MAASEEQIPIFIDRKVLLPDGRSFEIVKPLNNYRSCHDGTPQEARMVFVCTETTPNSRREEFVVKVKVQLPAEGQTAVPGPSTTTAAELEALEKFREAKTSFAPQLVAFHQQAQGENGPFPGGFINYTIMTKLPGFGLFGKYWNMDSKQREEIIPKTVEALRSIYDLGVEPGDRGIRNVIWDPETQHCGIVDFELWNPINGTFADDKNEMQRWGLIRPPPAKDHYAAFNAMYRS